MQAITLTDAHIFLKFVSLQEMKIFDKYKTWDFVHILNKNKYYFI